MQELSAISSQSCQASDCHCIKMFHSLDQICELQWQFEERQIWLPMAGSSCTGWSNLRYISRIYDLARYHYFAFDQNLLCFPCTLHEGLCVAYPLPEQALGWSLNDEMFWATPHHRQHNLLLFIPGRFPDQEVTVNFKQSYHFPPVTSAQVRSQNHLFAFQ